MIKLATTLAPAHLIRFISSLVACVSLLTAAPLLSAEPATISGDFEGTLSQESPGSWLLTSDQSSKSIQVPPGWKESGDWKSRTSELGSGQVVTEIIRTTRSGQKQVIVLVGPGDPVEDQLVWVGSRNEFGAGQDVFVDDQDGDGDLELLSRRPVAGLPDCGLYTEQLGLSIFSPESGQFRSVDVPVPVDSSQAVTPSTLTVADASALLARAVTGPGHRYGLWLDDRVGSPARFTDRDPNTTTSLSSGGLLVVRPFASVPPHSLVALGKGLIFKAHTGDGTLIASADTGMDGMQLAWPEGERCLVLRITGGELNEVGVLTPLDDKPRQEALAALMEDAIAGDKTRALAIASLLNHQPDFFLEGLTDAIQGAKSEEDYDRILLLANTLPERGLAQVALELASHPEAPVAVVDKATAVLARYPRASAWSLRSRLEGLEPGTQPYLQAASMLAHLPDSHAELGPLLNELDRRSEDADAVESALARLETVNPNLLVPTVSGFLGAEGMRSTTRQALLRALLRAPSNETPLTDPEAIAALAGHENLAMRLLALRIGSRWHIPELAEPSRSSLESEVDIERALALEALVHSTEKEAHPHLLSATQDTSPTVRISAAELLATAPFVELKGTIARLRALIDSDPWPRVRGAALLGLALAEHPDARILAAEWLNSADNEIALRQMAANAVAAGDLHYGWTDIERWVESEQMLRSTRRTLLLSWLHHDGSDLDKAAEAVVSWASAADDVDLHRLAGAAIATLAEVRYPSLAGLLVDVYDKTGDTQPLRQKTIELMGTTDTKAVRARLEEAISSSEPAVARAARRSLMQLDGQEIPVEPLDPFEVSP